jgi:hypothetical protein
VETKLTTEGDVVVTFFGTTWQGRLAIAVGTALIGAAMKAFIEALPKLLGGKQ